MTQVIEFAINRSLSHSEGCDTVHLLAAISCIRDVPARCQTSLCPRTNRGAMMLRQRLKQVVVRPVNDGDIDLGALQAFASKSPPNPQPTITT